MQLLHTQHLMKKMASIVYEGKRAKKKRQADIYRKIRNSGVVMLKFFFSVKRTHYQIKKSPNLKTRNPARTSFFSPFSVSGGPVPAAGDLQ